MKRATRTWAAKSCARCSKAKDRNMSRIGKRPVPVPSGVQANVEGQKVKVKGPKGLLELMLPEDVDVAMENGAVTVKPRNETKRARAMWGLSRSLVANLVAGVTNGFEKR